MNKQPASLPCKVVRGPFETERDTIPDSQIDSREETDTKWEVNNRRS